MTVRCGGHNVAGTAVADGAVLIDLSLMRNVVVDPDRQIAEAAGGCRLRDIDRATIRHGLACPAGVFSYTGLGGLALGGGYGWRCRAWGLTCDHILGAEMVLADGSIVDVSEESHPDLLWALRGGGGNFGVVTRFRLRLHPVGPFLVRGGVYGGSAATSALIGYRGFTAAISDDFHLLASLRHPRPGDPTPPGESDRPVLDLLTVCSADRSDSVAAAAEFFAAFPPGSASATTERTMSYLQLQAIADDSAPLGRRYYTKSGYLTTLPDQAIARLIDAAGRNPSATGSIDVEFLLGAISRTTEAESSFPQRDAPYMISAYASWDDPRRDPESIAWARETLDVLADWRHQGAYVNYVSQEENEATAAAMYGSALYARLARVKQRYDPDGAFRGTRVVAPAVADGVVSG